MKHITAIALFALTACGGPIDDAEFEEELGTLNQAMTIPPSFGVQHVTADPSSNILACGTKPYPQSRPCEIPQTRKIRYKINPPADSHGVNWSVAAGEAGVMFEQNHSAARGWDVDSQWPGEPTADTQVKFSFAIVRPGITDLARGVVTRGPCSNVAGFGWVCKNSAPFVITVYVDNIIEYFGKNSAGLYRWYEDYDGLNRNTFIYNAVLHELEHKGGFGHANAGIMNTPAALMGTTNPLNLTSAQIQGLLDFRPL